MDVSDYDRRQYHRIRQKAEGFERGEMPIHHLIADLKGLMAAIERPEADWRLYRSNDFPTLQVVYPTTTGIWPWQQQASQWFRKWQTMLAPPAS